MAFRPDTKYYIGSKEYDTIYEAFDAVRTMAKGTVIKDKNGTTVFTKDNNSNTYHLYQFNEYYGESADQNYSSGEVLPGLTNNSYGKMLTWLNNFAYSKAVDGNGELSNSRIRTLFRHSDVSLKAIYEEKQEKASGGYYSVATLSSAYDGKQNKAAKVVVNLSGIRTNLTNNTNAYFFVGMHSGTNTFECGLQLRKSGSSYKWYAICNSTLDKFETLSATPIANINGGGNVTVELVKEDGKITSTVYYNNVEKCSKVYKDSQFAASRSNEFYRTISFCPHDSNDNPTPNLNNGEYFTGTAFKECYIKRGSDSYVAWNYNSSFNQYAVAFNDEFIDVSVGSTEKADISYKGRDNNSKLIVT